MSRSSVSLGGAVRIVYCAVLGRSQGPSWRPEGLKSSLGSHDGKMVAGGNRVGGRDGPVEFYAEVEGFDNLFSLHTMFPFRV